MQTIYIDDPAWQTTFPHRVAPEHDEWLPGLLLRCDEVNYWGSRTTLTHLLYPGPEKFHRCWRTGTPNLSVIPYGSLNLDFLAQLLAIPTSVLLATTYHTELARIYDTAKPHPRHLNPSFSFHICPVCLAEERLLQRTLALPHITSCPEHHVALLGVCQCGTPLRLFHRQACPFTCHNCGRDWADLPRIKAAPSQLELEQKYLTWYAFFFSEGTPLIRQAAQYMMIGFSREPLSLGRLMLLLIQGGHSPQDVLNWVDQASLLQKRGMHANAYRYRNTSQRERRG
jgi:hypothetical protein